MASFCECRLKITTEDEAFINDILAMDTSSQSKGLVGKLKALFNSISKRPPPIGLLDYLRPMPDELAKQVSNGYSGEKLAWRKWRDDNWGCGDYTEINASKTKPNQLLISFETIYGVPVTALQYAANARHFNFELKYSDLGNGVVGTANKKDRKEYEVNFERPPTENGIPEDLIHEFNLNKVFLEAQKWEAAS